MGQPSELAVHFIEDTLDIAFHGHVAFDCNGLAAAFDNGVDNGSRRFLIALVIDRDRITLLRCTFRGRSANAPAAAGDQQYFFCQF